MLIQRERCLEIAEVFKRPELPSSSAHSDNVFLPLSTTADNKHEQSKVVTPSIHDLRDASESVPYAVPSSTRVKTSSGLKSLGEALFSPAKPSQLQPKTGPVPVDDKSSVKSDAKSVQSSIPVLADKKPFVVNSRQSEPPLLPPPQLPFAAVRSIVSEDKDLLNRGEKKQKSVAQNAAQSLAVPSSIDSASTTKEATDGEKKRKVLLVAPAAAPAVHRQKEASRFEVNFDPDEEANAIRVKKEAKMDVLRKKSEERSKSAGVYRRKSEVGGGNEGFEDRSVISVPTRRISVKDASDVVSRVSSKSTPKNTALVVDSHGEMDKGYLYYHELAMQNKGGIVVRTDEKSMVDGYIAERYGGVLSDVVVAQSVHEEVEGLVSPVPSQASKQRAVSVGRNIGRGGGTKLSNHQQVRNALVHVCMAGAHNDTARNEALQLMEYCSSGRVSLPPLWTCIVPPPPSRALDCYFNTNMARIGAYRRCE